MSQSNIPEVNKQPGIHYAFAPDGVELPIVDVTHPAFALAINDAEQRVLIAQFMRENQPFAKLPPLARRLLLRLLLRVVLRGSRLGQGVQRAQGTFMSAMDCYLLKLGPNNLPSVYSKPIDKRIAETLPSLSVRLRVQDIAHLLSDALAPLLSAQPQRPLHMLAIAGGPAIDCLNALLLLQREHPETLVARRITIDVLDMDRAGPAFGERALQSLQADGAPLHGLAIALRYSYYDWTKPEQLTSLLASAREQDALIIASSEGGLFEYGTDDAIVRNLEALRAVSPAVSMIAGSVTRVDDPVQRMRLTSNATIRPRGLALFRALAERAGWELAKAIERPFSDHVLLTPSI